MKRAVPNGLRHALILLSFVGLLHVNVVVPYLSAPPRNRVTAPYYFVAEYCRRLGLAPIWKMLCSISFLTFARWERWQPKQLVVHPE